MILSATLWLIWGMLVLVKTNKQTKKKHAEVWFWNHEPGILCHEFNLRTFPKKEFPNSFSLDLLNFKLCDISYLMKKIKVKMK